MFRLKKSAVVLLASLFLFAGPVYGTEAPQAQAEKNGDIVILYTSDVHCGIDQGFGYEGLQQVKDYLEEEGNDVILVDDGDSIRGEPIGTVTKGEAIIELMNQMGYSIAIPGNHEFDYGLDQFLALTEKADFPYVSCNFTYLGELVFEPYVIRELAGKKVAFVGVTTPKTLFNSTPTDFRNEEGEYVYGFSQDETGEGLYHAVQTAADAARAEGADYVVVMAHLGDKEDGAPWTYEDVISHTAGIDVMLDGHSHDIDQVVVQNAEGQSVPRSACGTKLECIGWCRITAEGEISTGLYTWNNEMSAPQLLGIENEISAAIAAATDEMNQKLEEVVAATEVGLVVRDPEKVDSNGKPLRLIRRMETNLGDLCADAYLDQSGADIAIVNGGGIKVDIKAGGITLGNILKVFPLGDALCVIEVTGQQILDALEWGTRAVPDEFGGFPQVAGLSYEICGYIDSPCVSDENGLFVRVDGERRVRNVLVGGDPIDPEKTYTLAGNNYMLLENGDGYTMFDGAPLLADCVKLDNQLLIDYITESLGGVIGPEYSDPYGQGRIRIIENAPVEGTRVLVVETTDIHGWLVDVSSGDPETYQYRMARLAKAIDEAGKSGKYEDVLLLDGGDEYQGPPISNLTQGAAVRAAMDSMDYDAISLGNHEFDWDVRQYCADEDGTIAPYELGDYSGDPDTPVLASNLYDAATGERVPFTRDYTVVEKAGFRIAVIGYIDDYSDEIMTSKIVPYTIDGSLERLDLLVREVNEKEKPDAVLVLAHAAPQPIAEAMDPDQVDLVLGGHKHGIAADTAENGIPYIQGNCYAQGFASAVLVFGPDGSVSVEEIQYTDLSEDKEALFDTEENLENLDETVLDISYAAWNIVWESLNEVLGYIDTPIMREKGVGANGAGNWVTGLMIRATEQYGVQAAFYNNGGIRTSFEIPEGESIRQITVNDIYTITPFGNTLLVYDITGPEMARQLADSLKQPNYGDQISGLTFTYTATGDSETPRDEREYTILGITMDDGTEVNLEDEETTYRVCTTNYNATIPGSVFEQKEPLYPEVDAPVDAEAFIEVLREMREENDGYISVDTGTRGVEVEQEEEALDPAA